MKPRWLVLKLLWLAYFSGVGFGGLGRKLTIPPEKEGRRRRAFGSCKKIQRYQVENDLATISILANAVRPSGNRRSDDIVFLAGTFSWHSWKAGPGEVMTEENLFI